MEPTFSNPNEEIAFWKSRAREAREELEEFQESSKELETELETQLEQAESRVKEYRSLANRLQMENDRLKDKLEQCQREYHCQVTELQAELGEIKSIRDQLSKYVRDLEQQNDDLERAKRSLLASLEDFESRLNAAIERNAFLESELDEKETLKAAVQRMKDETRDLKSELRVLAPRHPNLSSLDSSSLDIPDNDRKLDNNNLGKITVSRTNGEVDSNKMASDSEEKPIMETPTKSSPANAANLTPSARLSALNIVGDLLRKVGALELKLVSCRNIVKENSASGANSNNANSARGSPTSGRIGRSSPLTETPNGFMDRSKRIPRGSSTPSIKKIIES